ncbi:MAG: type I-MYXAN CRISPR-associated protein Cmx8 [Polyangiaceae bacterium]|nr:type I-MYXAN CRISPR-associated protein Cmx8 [Polyangiaceae bacterium]
MSRSKTTDKAAAKKRPTGADVITLSYDLGELPTAQHRAGLAGLAMILQWLDAQPDADRKGTYRLEGLSRRGLSFSFDGPGLQWLFDWLYASDEEEREEPQPRKKKNKEIDPPLREFVKEEAGKDGKVRQKKVYVYPTVVPKGAMLLSLDPTRQGNNGLWIKLWRDFVWGILRGVPAQREPFEARAEKRVIRDGEDLHLALAQAPDASVPLPSTYYLGAQAKTAEGVLFQDRARWQLLLHFWPYVAQLYVPRVIDLKDGKTSFDGIAVAIPDVASLDDFAAELVAHLAHRSPDVLLYLPRGAVVDLPVEAALDTAARLRAQMGARASRFEGLVTAYEVFHVRKDGNNVRMLQSSRVDPTDLVDRYRSIRESYSDPLFRRRQIVNLLEEQRQRRIPGLTEAPPEIPWYAGFERDAATAPHEKAFFGSRWFRRDARHAFMIATQASIGARTEQKVESRNREPSSIDALVYRLVRDYVSRRVKAKYDLDFSAAKENPSKQKQLNEAREKVARDAFLAVRSRTNADFAEYFAGTIGSVPHRLHEPDFVELARHLRDDELRADVRTLTLLALSAAAWAPSTEKKTDSKGDEP